MNPRYLHDCLNCKFLGHHAEYDLYHCPQDGFETVVARYGNEGDEYTSGMKSSHLALIEARSRIAKAECVKKVGEA